MNNLVNNLAIARCYYINTTKTNNKKIENNCYNNKINSKN